MCAVGSVCVNIFEINKFPGSRRHHVTDRRSASIKQCRSKCKSMIHMFILALIPHEVMVSVNNQLALIKQRENLAILIAVCHKHVKYNFVRGNRSRETSHRCAELLKQLFGGWAFFFGFAHSTAFCQFLPSAKWRRSM